MFWLYGNKRNQPLVLWSDYMKLMKSLKQKPVVKTPFHTIRANFQFSEINILYMRTYKGFCKRCIQPHLHTTAAFWLWLARREKSVIYLFSVTVHAHWFLKRSNDRKSFSFSFHISSLMLLCFLLKMEASLASGSVRRPNGSNGSDTKLSLINCF